MNRRFKQYFHAAAVLLPFFLCSPSVFAQTEAEKKFLSMYFTEEELTVESATRSNKPRNQVAENMTVVTAADIEAMNAHSVADVLNTVTGVLPEFFGGGPGQYAQVVIQGSMERQVTVIIDGIVLNTLSDNFVDIGSLPVQNIEKLEIIKGPASSSWGSSLGGVVNIITKAGSKENKTEGMFSQSYGSKDTNDFRLETRGRQDKLGYYMTAGRLESDGLVQGFGVANKNVYVKLTYGLTDKTDLYFSIGDVIANQTQFFPTPPYPGTDKLFAETTHAAIGMNSKLTNNLALNVSVHSLNYRNSYNSYDLQNALYGSSYIVDTSYGASAKLTWKKDEQTIVLGADYDKGSLRVPSVIDDQVLRKQAVYMNDTLTIDKISITPGIRYENTNQNGDFTSPSLGATYSLSDNTMLRAYVARGYNMPPFGYNYSNPASGYIGNPNIKMETVWSYQAGVETAQKYAWLKFSVFQHNVRDAINQRSDVFSFDNIDRIRRDGFEVELKTVPLYNLALSAGWIHVDEKNLITGQSTKRIPANVYDAGVHYDDKQSFKALLQGRYIHGNEDPNSSSNYSSLIVDLHLAKQLYKKAEFSMEIFADGHNILNGTQYFSDLYKNAKPWYEAGMRVKF